LYGDRSGSPRRDDRQYGDDVKVAGAPVAGRRGSATTVTRVEYVPAYQAPVGEHVSATDPATAQDGGAATRHEAYEYERAAGYGSTAEQGPEEAYGEATVPLGGVAADETAYLPECEVTRDDLPPVPRVGAAGRRRAHASRPSTRRIKALGVAVAVTVAVGGAIAGWALTAGSGQKEAARQGPAQAQGPPPLTDAQRRAAEARRLRELKRRASRAARHDDSRPTLFAKGTPPVTKKPEPSGLGGPTPVGDAQQIARAMLPDFGWKPSEQFGCLVNLWDKESHWNTHASSPTGAYGIPQALPGSKMASAGPDWQNNARTQIKWGLGYIQDRYASPCDAWQHSEATGWY
jgi:hypothetical protein